MQRRERKESGPSTEMKEMHHEPQIPLPPNTHTRWLPLWSRAPLTVTEAGTDGAGWGAWGVRALGRTGERHMCLRLGETPQPEIRVRKFSEFRR